jgi:hypothetical protein
MTPTATPPAAHSTAATAVTDILNITVIEFWRSGI